MKLANFEIAGRQGFGYVEDGQIHDLSGVLPRINSVDDLLAHGVDVGALIGRGNAIGLDAVSLLPPVLRPRLMAMIGLNYATHIKETGRETPRYPSIFTRTPDSVVGHEAPLVRPRLSTRFDFEGELAVVIGKGGRHISEADALAHVAGYTLFNDGSIRDYQRHTIQFFPGKNFWRSGSVGPWLVTADDAPAPASMTLTTRLNGIVMQHAPLSDLVFGVPQLIAYLSQVAPLVPGDIIATGTPGGVGDFREPAVYMAPGDIVEVEIPGVGLLRNPVIDEGTADQGATDR